MEPTQAAETDGWTNSDEECGLTPDHTELRDLRTLVQRSKHSGVVVALLSTLLLFAERERKLALWFLALAVWSWLVGVARLIVAQRMLNQSCEVRCKKIYFGLVLATGAGWSFYANTAILWASADEVLLLAIVSAGMAAGSATTLASERWLPRLYVLVILVPMAGVLGLGAWKSASWIAVSTLCFALYILMSAEQHSRAYRDGLHNAALLEQRALRLGEERRRAEEALVKADLANRAKSTFLANMSHELRTPLTAILGFAELQQVQPEKGREHADVIVRNGEHLLRLIDDILDMSKIEAGKMEVFLRPVYVPALVSEVAAVLRQRAASKGLRLVVNADTPIPARITADDLRMRQILLNLVGNAIKFTEQGEVAIRLHFDPHEGRLEFCVSDTGPGIAPGVVNSLFQPFVQAEGGLGRAPGTGLGLYISRCFARLMDGDIQVTSQPGVGSTFRVVLGVSAEEARECVEISAKPTQEQRMEVKSQVGRLRGARILLAEDGADNRRLIVSLLEHAGASVDVVGDGQAAVQKILISAAGQAYDVVLMDMELPKLNGYQATQKLRQLGYDGAIFALTAHAMTQHIERSLQSGCDEHLTKPLDRAALINAIARRLKSGDTAPTDPVGGEVSMSAANDGGARSQRVSIPSVLRSTLPADDVIATLIPGFVTSLQRHAETLLAANAGQDREEILRVAHQLRGAAGSYGFAPISEAAIEVEHAREDEERRIAVERLASMCRRATGS